MRLIEVSPQITRINTDFKVFFHCHFSDKSSTTRQSEAKNLECINVGVHEILRFALDDNWEGDFLKPPWNSMYSVVQNNSKLITL